MTAENGKMSGSITFAQVNRDGSVSVWHSEKGKVKEIRIDQKVKK